MKDRAQKIVAKHKANDGKPGNENIKDREKQSIETLPKEVKSNCINPAQLC